MKYLILFLGFWSFSATAQFTIQRYTQLEVNSGENHFPIIESLTNLDAALRINQFLHHAALQKVYKKVDTNRFDMVFPPEGEIWGASNFTYEINTNSPQFFSVSITYDYTGAYSEYHTQHYNFIASTGEHISLEDVFEPSELLEISTIVDKSCHDQITTFIQEVDTTTFEGGEQKWMYEECLVYFEDHYHEYSNEFYITDTSFVFERERCSNHAMRALDDLWGFSENLDFDLLQMFFNEPTINFLNGEEWSPQNDIIPNDKVLHGTVGKYPISMILYRTYSGELNGVYWYNSQNKPIKLSGKVDEAGVVYMDEVFDGIHRKAIKGKFENGVFTGEWLQTKLGQNWKVELRLD